MLAVLCYSQQVCESPHRQEEGNDNADPSNQFSDDQSEGARPRNRIQLLLDVVKARHAATHHDVAYIDADPRNRNSLTVLSVCNFDSLLCEYSFDDVHALIM